MPTFGDVLKEMQDVQVRRQREGVSDPIRRKYIKALRDLTERNVVVYYSGWLHRQGPEHYSTQQINDEDKHGFMAAFANLNFDQGLDLVVHTPGGDVAATESIIDYLRSKFGRKIRVIVPQISMSGGTMIALAAHEIIMGRHSNLGPIDPQIGNRPAVAILAEFERAREEIQADPKNALIWQPILQQYVPTLLSHCQQGIAWAREIGEKTLREGMFADESDPAGRASTIVDFLLSHDVHKAHGRHLHRTELRQAGLRIVDLEDDPALQDAVLSVHHACMLTVGNHGVSKLIENHNGITHAKVISNVAIPVPAIQFAPPPAQPAPLPQPGPPPVPQQPVQQAPITSAKIPLRQRIVLALRVILGR